LGIGSNNDVVEELDLEELTGANEIAGHFDVRLGRRLIAAGMAMLCAHASYVESFLLAAQKRRFGRFDQTGFFT
jgi:hypothetical protein